MSTAKLETVQTVALFERIKVLQDVARRVDADDRQRLIDVVRSELETSPPIRPGAAAVVLELSEKTVRAWMKEGVLRVAVEEPRVLIDPNALHAVARAVTELRAAGKTRNLLDDVHRRLVDATWLDRGDLSESLDEMRSGIGTVRIPKAG